MIACVTFFVFWESALVVILLLSLFYLKTPTLSPTDLNLTAIDFALQMLLLLGNPIYGLHSLSLSFPTKYFWPYIQKETGGDSGGDGGGSRTKFPRREESLKSSDDGILWGGGMRRMS